MDIKEFVHKQKTGKHFYRVTYKDATGDHHHDLLDFKAASAVYQAVIKNHTWVVMNRHSQGTIKNMACTPAVARGEGNRDPLAPVDCTYIDYLKRIETELSVKLGSAMGDVHDCRNINHEYAKAKRRLDTIALMLDITQDALKAEGVH